MKRVVVCGGCGKMASLAATYFYHDDSLELVGIIESPTHSAYGKDWGEIMGLGKSGILVDNRLENIINNCDVVVDFTNPEASMLNLAICENAEKALIIGTTGLSDKQVNVIKKASDSIPILLSPNMALAVNLLFDLVRKVASVLDDNYDIEIIETHHRYKKDAPSGTAKKIAEIIAQEKRVNLAEKAVYGRVGDAGPRRKGEIGIHAVRAGNINGEHTIIFNSNGERLEITHRAFGREAFAEGALRAVHFILKQRKGLYSMKEVLNL